METKKVCKSLRLVSHSFEKAIQKKAPYMPENTVMQKIGYVSFFGVLNHDKYFYICTEDISKNQPKTWCKQHVQQLMLGVWRGRLHNNENRLEQQDASPHTHRYFSRWRAARLYICSSPRHCCHITAPLSATFWRTHDYTQYSELSEGKNKSQWPTSSCTDLNPFRLETTFNKST